MMASEIATIWTPVFSLPDQPAAITTPSAAATLRKAPTANSRARIAATIQAGVAAGLSSTNEMKAEAIRILSAAGSSSWPSLVTWRQRRARNPSRKSVSAAARKSAKP